MERRKTCKTTATTLLILLAILIIDAPVAVHAKSPSFTATISPAEIDINQLATYSVNITNTGDSTLGSTSIAIPEGFTVLPPVTIVTPPSSWNYTLSTTAISLTAIGGGSSVNPGECVIFAFAAIAPASSGVSTWTAEATSSIGGGGVVLTLDGAQPTVTVAIPVFTITVTQTAHGTINPGTTSVTLGGNQSFTISPDIGYQIADVLVDGIPTGAETSFIFTDVNADHQLTATFTPIEHTLIVNIVGGGSVVKSPDQVTYHYGDVVHLTAIPASGWRFSVWTGDLTGAANPSSITINGNNAVTATFLTNQFTITAITGAGGSINPPGTTIVDYGGSQAFTITPNAGYHIVNVLINSTSVGSMSSYTISNLTGDTTITASFALDTFKIEASANPNGSINPDGIVTVTYCNAQSFTISPDTGYHIADVLVDGISVGAVTSYTFTEVVANHNITANFAISAEYYFIKVASSHGSPTPSAQVNAGDSFTASVTSPEGDTSHQWICTGYSIDGGAPVSGTSYTFINVQANHTITYNWQEQYYLTVISLDGSTTGTGWYNTGTTATVSVSGNPITSDNGIRQIFTGWTGDATGTDTTSNPITIDSPKTATATWKTQYQVTYATSDNALQVTAPPTEWVDERAQATGAFPTSITNSAGNIKIIFVSDNRPTAITEPITVTGTYQTQYLVTFIQNGIASDASGTVATILGEIKTYEQFPNSAWINAGDSITFSYVATVESTETDKQYILTSTNFPSPLTINEPTTIQGYYEPKINSSSFTLSTFALEVVLLSIPPMLTIPLLAGRRNRNKKITPIANEGGSISPSTVQTIERGGDSMVFIITANSGYRIADVVVDNAVHLGAIRTYKFVNVTKNHTISATFHKE